MNISLSMIKFMEFVQEFQLIFIAIFKLIHLNNLALK